MLTGYYRGFFVAISKTATIHHIQRCFFELPMYMRYIEAYHSTTAIDIIFCNAPQWQYKKQPQYMCLSGISFSYSDGILNHHNICIFAACFLSYSGGFSGYHNRPFNCPNPFLVQNFPSVFFFSPKPTTLALNLFIYYLFVSFSKIKNKK